MFADESVEGAAVYQTKRTYNATALALCGVLLAGLCIVVAMLIGYTLSKRNSEAALPRSAGAFHTRKGTTQAQRPTGTQNETANVVVPNSSGQNPGSREEIQSGDYPATRDDGKFNKTGNVRDEFRPKSGVNTKVSNSPKSAPLATSTQLSNSDSRALAETPNEVNNAIRSASSPAVGPKNDARIVTSNSATPPQSNVSAGTSNAAGADSAGVNANLPQKSATINSDLSRGDTNETISRGDVDRSARATVFPTYSADSVSPRVRPSSVSPRAISTVPNDEIFKINVGAGHSSTVDVSGERVLESAAGRIRIERSVFLPNEHKSWWPLHRNKEKEVRLGSLLSRVDPPPSRLALRSVHQVRVRALVDREGHVVALRPVSGPVELMPTVVRAVRQWRYLPSYVDGTPVETEAYITIEFLPSSTSDRVSR